jgi:ABC-2 type transport system permease protein
MLLATYTLWLREIVRFYRDRTRVVGALGSPLVFWFLIGSGLGRSFTGGPGQQSLPGGYLQYFYPGTLALILLFTAIFSTISIIEDRQAGFLQGVLVAPVPRSAIVLGKILGGTTLAAIQGGIFLLLAPLAHVTLHVTEVPGLVLTILLASFGVTGLGFLIAWRLDSTQGFHAIMNLFLIPMWILSGALFPPSGAAGWVRLLMLVNPLTYGVSALRVSFSGGDLRGEPPLILSIGLMAAFSIVILALGASAVRQRRARAVS